MGLFINRLKPYTKIESEDCLGSSLSSLARLQENVGSSKGALQGVRFSQNMRFILEFFPRLTTVEAAPSHETPDSRLCRILPHLDSYVKGREET